MSLILCRNEPVVHPYYIESLGIHIYSSQELCYVMHNHPLLVLDGFVDDHLIGFIRDELDMGFLALKMERLKKSGESSDELLFMYMQECNYYTAAEMVKYKQQVAALRKLKPADYQKTKADYLFRFKQYGKAISGYERLLEDLKEQFADSEFHGRVWHNLGSAYARVFRFDKAFHAFDMSYGFNKDLETLKKIYYLTLFDKKLVLRERYHSLLTPELRQQWDMNLLEATDKVKDTSRIQELDSLFEKDWVRRLSGASETIQQWKQEYRQMV